MIHIIDGQNDTILDYITLNNIVNDTHLKSLENTLETYDATVFGDIRYNEFLEKRNRIIIPDEDDNYVEFILSEVNKYRDRSGLKTRFIAVASYLDLQKTSIIYPDNYQGTASQHVGRALINSGWRVGIIETERSITINIEEHTNPYVYLRRLANELGMELRFRTENNGNRITGRYVDLLERVGEWNGREVTFGKDLDGIRRIEKQDVVTALLGIGPADENGNRFEVLVEDEEALERWGRIDEHGNIHHLIEPYFIESVRFDMTEEEARQYTRTALDKRINTQVTYEADIIDLEHVPGMQNKKIRFGDTIRIKDEKFNPPLYLEARVFEQQRSIKDKSHKIVKLGDFVEFTEDEIHDIWNQLREQIRDKISQAELIEYTYDKLTIDGKDDDIRTDVETYARTVSDEAKDEAITYTNNTVEPIVIQVGELEDEVANHDEAIVQAQSDISQAFDDICLVVTRVEQTEDRVEANEGQINVLAGEVEIKANQDYVDLIENRVGEAEGQITTLAGIIELKADSTVVDDLGTRVTTAELSIDGLEGQIQTKVSEGDVRSIFTQEADSFTFD